MSAATPAVPPASIPVDKSHITRTPGVCGGKPCVAGHRIRVQDIYVLHELQRMTPDEIVNDFPQITLADVYAAMAYYWDHRDEVLADMKREDELVEQTKAATPSLLARRLAERKAQG